MKRCDTLSRAVIKGFDPVLKRIYLFQPRCKMWKCLPCAHTNKLLWQARISNGYEHYIGAGIKDWRFTTLTSHPKLKTAEQCQYVWRSAWPKLSARMRRKYLGIRYVLLPEYHKDGRVHWHMICSSGVEKRWLKNTAPKCGLGFMVDCEPIKDNITAIFYVSKYIGKSIGIEKWPQNLKRIRTSQKWPELPPSSEEFENIEANWHFWLKYPVEGMSYLAHELERDTGYPVHVVGGYEKVVDN